MHAPPEVPPASWIDDMRTPPLDVVLGQFRAQKGGPADGAADTAAPAEPATLADAVAEEPAETPRSGEQPFSCPRNNVESDRGKDPCYCPECYGYCPSICGPATM